MERTREDGRRSGIRMRTVGLAALLLALLASLAMLREFRAARAAIEARSGLMPPEYHEMILSILGRQYVLTFALLALLIVTVLAMTVLILWPIQTYIRELEAFHELPPKGAYELRYLARAYNTVFDEYRRHNGHLLYQAEHDGLTGLLNRRAFDGLRRSQEGRHIGLMLIDVDRFKEVNDTWGHQVGDQVLQRVADLLANSFRPSDYPCRTGGDEFAVIITDISPSVKDAIRRKMTAVTDALREGTDGLPPVTLSVGAAFSDQCPEGDDLYVRADAALYRVKARGRDGFAFYEDEEEARAV